MTISNQRAAIVDAAAVRFDRFIEFAVARAAAVDPKWVSRFDTPAANGRSDLRFAPRDGAVPDEVLPLIEHWFEILDLWIANEETDDLEALNHWAWSWTTQLVRELLFVGLRSPDGLDQECYALGKLLPRSTRLLIEIEPDSLRVHAEPPAAPAIEFRRNIGSDTGLGPALRSVIGSLAAQLREREEPRR